MTDVESVTDGDEAAVEGALVNRRYERTEVSERKVPLATDNQAITAAVARPDTIDPDVTPEVIAEHYRRATPALRILGAYGDQQEDDEAAPQTLPVNDHYGWYRSRDPIDAETDAVVEKRCWQFLSEFDTWIDRINRALYTTPNYQSPESLRWVGRKTSTATITSGSTSRAHRRPPTVTSRRWRSSPMSTSRTR